MQYTKESKIVAVADVKEFFSHLVDERKVAFHPDDRFEDYMSEDGGVIYFLKKSALSTTASWTRVLRCVKRMMPTSMALGWS